MKVGQLSRQALLWQLLSVVVVTLPHLFHLPWWVPVLVTITVGWRFMVYSGRWSFPPWWVKAFFVLGAGLGVLVSYKTGGGISATVTLLIVGFGLKVIELLQRRDSYVILYVAYLVAASQFLFTQSILMAIYIVFALLIVTTALLNANLNRDISFISSFKRTFLMCLPAFPLMIILFIGMPRLGPIWEVGLDKSMAKTGLSDSMSPGDITKLTRSSDVAFRVSFESALPPQKELYWRAIVLNDFDGRRWSSEKIVDEKLNTSRPLGDNEPWDYELILEPTQQKYIPALEYVTAWKSGLTRYADFTLRSQSLQTMRQQYKFSSQALYVDADKHLKGNFQRELALPKGNDEARALAHRWWKESGTPTGFIAKIQHYYNQSFSYSLTPPGLGENSVSDFLLETKVGFCGHFSSATAFLLREVGIPARVVTGYQGGEWNPLQKYYLIRQYDAHAWVEAWLPNRGWVRIDPTAWVAPERVEAPAEDAFLQDETFLRDSPLSRWGLSGNGLLAGFRMRLEAMNYGWHRWVLNYHHQQKGFLEQMLGAFSPIRMALFFVIPFSIVIGITVLMMLRNRFVNNVHPHDKQINRLSAYFERYQLGRNKGEAVSDYCQRLAIEKPERKHRLADLSALFERMRYAEDESTKDLSLLKHYVDLCLHQ